MPYVINKFNGEPLVILEDGVLNTSTSLGFLGRNYTGYGETQNENFLHLLENFANPNAPSRPIEGQTWFDTVRKVLNVYNGSKWERVGAAEYSTVEPSNPAVGSFWLKEPSNVLYVWTGQLWEVVGPEAAEGFGITRGRSTVVRDSDGALAPVILLTVNNVVIAIVSSREFTLSLDNPISGFNQIGKGITLSDTFSVSGNVIGKASSADRLDIARTINGVPFNGTSNIVIKSSTTGKLKKGSYIIGSDFDGSSEQIWDIDATPSNLIGKIVARNSNGDFSANNITANIIGNLQGNVTTTVGTSNFNIVSANQFIGATLSGNALTATRLQTSRSINGISFDGTSNITVPASALTLTGNTLNPLVRFSSLTQLGTLSSLSVIEAGITVGTAGQLSILIDNLVPTIRNNSSNIPLQIQITDSGVTGSAGIWLLPSNISFSNGGDPSPTVAPSQNSLVNLGHPSYRFKKVYSEQFIGNLLGNSATATQSGLSTNIIGGSSGAIPYQSGISQTSLLSPGLNGQLLKSGGPGAAPFWDTVSFSNLTPGTHIIGAVYNASADRIWSIDATSDNVANKIVSRNSTGEISVGRVNLSQSPTQPQHAVTKSYVDNSVFVATYGNTVFSISGFTNQVGSFNNGANYFDVFPPAGKTMSSLVAFIPSIAVIHFAGGVNGDDSMRCTWADLGDRIRVWVQNTEQRSTPAGNFLALWR